MMDKEYPKGTEYRKWRRPCGAGTVLLCMALLLMLSGCGRGKEEDAAPEGIYVPEFIPIEGEYVDYDGARVAGNHLCYLSFSWNEEIQYYTQVINRLSLEERTLSSFPLAWPEGPQAQAAIEYTFGADGCLYVIAQTFPGEGEGSELLLCKFQPEGTQDFSRRITEQLRKNPEEGLSIEDMEIDGQDRIYIAGKREVCLYDGQGQYQGAVSPEDAATGQSSSNQSTSDQTGSDQTASDQSTSDQSASDQSVSEKRVLGQASIANPAIDGLYRDGNGKVYMSYGEEGQSGSGGILAEINYEDKNLTIVCTDYPGGSLISPQPGESFLLQDRTCVRIYDPAAVEEGEILFAWMDCDIAGSSVLSFGQTQDGRIAAVLQTQDGHGELALLTKVSPDQAAQKETLVLGVLTGGYNYEPAVVRFNRSNEKYRVVLKEYYNYEENGGLTMEDALAKLYTEIASDNCPDLLEVTGLNLAQLAAKGAFQDLGPCLEKSEAFHREDFLEEVLEAYTFDGTLATIPYAVFLETVMGHEGQTGQRAGWTPEQVIALAEANPEAELFDGADRNDAMNFLMEYGEDAFVDWNTGECGFDTEQFKNLLQFVRGFPETVDYDPDRPSVPARVQAGEVLLKTVDLYNFNTIQIDLETFGGDAVCIGYPAGDGGRHAMTAIFSYAITSKSKQKEGAWAFMEYILGEEGGSNGMGFPTLRRRLEESMEEAIAVKYVLDEKGEIYLDENGEPVVLGNTSSVQYGDGWSYTYHTPTRQEAELILSLLKDAHPVFADSGNEIRNIIVQEAEAFFQGQKSVEEVSKIIQNRVKLYVDENR